jgi:nitrogen fixation NifU-like protein
MNIYHHILMDHHRNPRHYGTVISAHFLSNHSNPACGDSITFTGFFDNDILIRIGFTGSGCVIAIASASLLSEKVLNSSRDYILSLAASDMQQLIGLSLGPVRIGCALLPLEVLHKGILSC